MKTLILIALLILAGCGRDSAHGHIEPDNHYHCDPGPSADQLGMVTVIINEHCVEIEGSSK